MAAENDLLADVETVVDVLVSTTPPDAEHTRFLLDALGAATDNALSSISGRIECHTARGAELDTRLAALRSAARGREAKAAVALLAARAAEGAGDSTTAAELVDEALTLRPGMEPALHDGAQYAATRGDYATADRYLRRAEKPSPLRPGLSDALAACPAEVGRNTPCPCGSGRKFKVCCQRTAAPALTARAPLIYALLGTYAERAPGLEMITPLLDRAEDGQRCAMFLLDLALFQGGLVERFLASRGDWLRPEERDLVERWRQIPVTLYETCHVERDSSVTLRALPDGEPIHLVDTLFSHSVHRLELLCGRVLHDGTEPRVLALPVHVPRHRRRELVALLCAAPSMDQIADIFAPEPPLQLRTVDGDEVHDCSVTYQLPGSQQDSAQQDSARQVFERLAERLTRTGDGVLARHRPLPDGRVLNVGQIHRDGDTVTLTANSPTRLADLEAVLVEVAPGVVELNRRVERLSPDPDGREARVLVLESYVLDTASDDEDVDEAADRMSRDAETAWLDTPGVIGELSPREAACSQDGAVRTELRSTIDDVEATLLQTQRAGRPTTGLMSPQRLRAALNV